MCTCVCLRCSNFGSRSNHALLNCINPPKCCPARAAPHVHAARIGQTPKTLRANGRRRPECCGRSGRVACGDCGGRRRGVVSNFVVLSHSAELHSEERRILRAMHRDNGDPAGDMLWTDVLDIAKLTVPMPLPFMAMRSGNRFHIPFKLISGPVFRQQVCDSAVEWSGRARLLSLFMKFRALNNRPTLVSALILNFDVGNFDYSAPYRSRSRSKMFCWRRARDPPPQIKVKQ